MRLSLYCAAILLTASPVLADMSASFEWGPTTKCFDRNSPPFRLSGVPAGTTKLQFQMTDLDATDFNHGGGSVAYSGEKTIPYGAFKYTGPCPPTRHKYRFDIKAYDGKGKVIGKTSSARAFP